MTAKIKHAEMLRERGFYVFPIVKFKKRPPAIKGWQDWATRNPEKLRVHWGTFGDHNIGLSTSQFGDDEALLVLDIDVKDGRDGEASLRELEAKHGPLPDTFTQGTPTGGWHLVYRVKTAVSGSASKLGDGLDVRSAGGYVVGAGSTVAQGEYTIEKDLPIAEAPQWVVDLCGKSDEPAAPTGEPIVAPSADARAVRYLNSLPVVASGQRNVEGFKVAAQLKDFGLDAGACELAMCENWRCEPMLHIEELRTLIASAYKRGGQGSNAPEQDFDVFEHEENPVQSGNALKSLVSPHFDRPSVQELRATPPKPRFIISGLLPATAAALVAPGGTGKTALLIHQAVHIILGRPWFGHEIEQPGAIVYCSAEEERADVMRILNLIMKALDLSAADQEQVAENFYFEDFAGRVVRLVEVGQNGNLFITRLADELIAKYKKVGISVVYLDPANLLGPGERHVNDGEALLMVAARRVGRALGCATQYAAHTAKDVLRSGTVDQFAARGGAAFSDNSRCQMQLVSHTGDEKKGHKPPVGIDADVKAGCVLRLHVTKLNWAKRPNEPIWIVRHGFQFRRVVGAASTPSEDAKRERAANMAKIVRFVQAKLGEGKKLTTRSLRDTYRDEIGLSKHGVEQAVNAAVDDRLLVERDLPKSERRGNAKTFLAPAKDVQAMLAKVCGESPAAGTLDAFAEIGDRPFGGGES